MTYKLAIEERPGYLHFTVTGRNSKENVMSYLQELMQECIARQCRRVLIEERLDGPRLGTMDVFQIAAQGGDPRRMNLQAMAYVDVHAEGDSMDFAETVAVNRGVPIAVFPTVAEAERWLQGQVRADAGSPGDPGTTPP